jgi:hypothetical protein
MALPYRITSPVLTVSIWNPAPVSQPEPAGDTVDAMKIIVMQIIATMITWFRFITHYPLR